VTAIMQVTAVSVSVPRTIEIHGRPVVTSIVHNPHPGPIAFGRGGPARNATAVHTEEVLAMAAENYDGSSPAGYRTTLNCPSLQAPAAC
jgi:hypothetical protein